ncbi:MAG: hypothetical protein KF752_00640 [Pirellulaceae bacterium]|nr:hypothetical protein [Pirellulaceae bacterium]
MTWDDVPTITLHYRWPGSQDERIPVRLQTTPTQFGGQRWWFTCPLIVDGVACKRRAGKLQLPPEAEPAATLGAFLQSWRAAHTGDYKPASLIAWGLVIDALTEFLGADCPIAEVTPAKGEAFAAIHAGGRPSGNHDSQAAAPCPHVLCPRKAARLDRSESV